MIRKALAAILAAAALAGPAAAADLRVACCSGGNECEATADPARRFPQTNPDMRVGIDQVPFDANRITLEPMLPAPSPSGKGPG